MPETLAALFLAHVLADYVFQTKHMVETKDTARSMLLHIATVWATAAFCLGTWGGWALLLLAGLHLIIDLLKTHITRQGLLPDGAAIYIADQIAHIASLIGIAALAPGLFHNGLWGGVVLDTSAWLPLAMTLSAGAIYATRAGRFCITLLMTPYTSAPDSKEPQALDGAGALIGTLERILIYILTLSGMTAGIGFLVAAKSILRFGTVRDAGPTEDRKTSEYIIIGTLASFGWAIAVSLGVIALLNALDALPLLEIGAAAD
ncbi:DUF3307 domain-containing protein [Celeribacter sp. ULVN23_4]